MLLLGWISRVCQQKEVVAFFFLLACTIRNNSVIDMGEINIYKYIYISICVHHKLVKLKVRLCLYKRLWLLEITFWFIHCNRTLKETKRSITTKATLSVYLNTPIDRIPLCWTVPIHSVSKTAVHTENPSSQKFKQPKNYTWPERLAFCCPKASFTLMLLVEMFNQKTNIQSDPELSNNLLLYWLTIFTQLWTYKNIQRLFKFAVKVKCQAFRK